LKRAAVTSLLAISCIGR